MLAMGVAACGEVESATVGVPLYDDLGGHEYAISTSEPLAQRYFDQGLRLYYAFNHDEAIRAFDEGARLDPNCAMCYWGRAASLGPNINMPQTPEAALAAYEALQQAQAVAHHAGPVEQALIEALSTRYAANPPENRAPLDSAYARAMGDVAARFPDDVEVATLHAESLMDLSPWSYWERDGTARPDTPELLAQLEKALAASPDHPGANHFFIHAVEAVDPERAVPMAERLAGLMPGAGHLVHMPGHIYIRVGRYEDAIRANEHAVHADESYIQDQNPAMGIYTLGYYPHNYDFLAFAASMIGRDEQAIGAVDRMVELVPEEVLFAPGMSLLQNVVMRPYQMRVRFGRWDEILATDAPAAELGHARAMWHYARGRALAATGDVDGAERELAAVRIAARDPEITGLQLEFNKAGAILGMAERVLGGIVAAGRGDHDQAFSQLREGAAIEDGLVYGEPPEWSVPVRQELGVLLLEQGRAAEAEQAFREDLERFPDNGWSLRGLGQALAAQGRVAEAERVAARFEAMWGGAEVEVEVAGRYESQG